MKPMLRMSIVLACAAACGSGPAAAATPKDYMLPYIVDTDGTQAKGVVLVKSNDFTTKSFVSGSTAVVDPQIHRTGTPQDDVLINYRPHFLIYGQGGKWRRVSLRAGLQPTSSQISSESLVAKRCLTSRLIPVDFKVADSPFLLYQLPGPDGKCGKGGDDIFRTVKITDAATTAPVKVKAQTLLLTQIYSGEGALLAHLGVQRNKTLTRFNSTLTTTKDVLTDVTQFVLAGQAGNGMVVAIVNGNLRRIQVDGTPDAIPLRTPATGFQVKEAVVRNDLVYWVEQSALDPQNPTASKSARIFRVPVAGGTVVQMVTANSALSISGFTTNKLLYSEGGGITASGIVPVKLKAIARTAAAGAASSSLYTESQGFLQVFNTRGSRVFFNTFSIGVSGQTQTARTVLDNATGAGNQGAGSAWIGSQIDVQPLSDASSSNVVRLLLARNGLDRTTRGAALFSFDPASLASAALPGADLVDNNTPSLGVAIGPAGLGNVSVENEEDGNLDVFAFDLVGKRFKRLVNNTVASEVPVY